MLVGAPWVDDKKLYNAYLLLEGGKIAAVRYKVELPNYGVFDEKRVFASGPLPGPIVFKGVRIGIPICEDIWHAGCRRMHFGNRRRDPAGPERLALSCATRPMCASTSRSHVWSRADCRSSISTWSADRTSSCSTARSFVLNADRSFALQLPAFREAVVTTQWVRENGTWRCLPGEKALIEEDDEADYAACVLGLRDYVNKNGFKGVVFGLSGGIDFALCAAMAVDALGADRVRAVMLPYRYTSQELARRCGGGREGARHPIRRGADRGAGRRLRGGAEAAVCRHQSRHHGRKSPVAHARHDPDGDLEQVRHDAGHDRQQVRDVGRLRDDLRRHERRLQSDQGSLQDAGVPAVQPAQHVEAAGRARAGRRGHSGARHHQAADRGAAREPEGPGHAAALRRARRHPASASSSARSRSPTSWRRASTSTTVRA